MKRTVGTSFVLNNLTIASPSRCARAAQSRTRLLSLFFCVNAVQLADMRVILVSSESSSAYLTSSLGDVFSHFSYSLEETAKREQVPLKKSALVKTWLDQAKTKDYGKIPLDMLEEYLIGDLDSTEQAIKSLLYKLETRQ